MPDAAIQQARELHALRARVRVLLDRLKDMDDKLERVWAENLILRKKLKTFDAG